MVRWYGTPQDQAFSTPTRTRPDECESKILALYTKYIESERASASHHHQ